MTRSHLKNKANKSGNKEANDAYRKQRNYVTKLNRKLKKELLRKSISPQATNGNLNIWKICKPFFTDKEIYCDQKTSLIEDKLIVSDEEEVANIFNHYFVDITKSLPITEWVPPNNINIKNNIHDSCIKYYEIL